MAISRVPFSRLNRHEVVAEHQVDRDRVEQIVVDAGFLEIDEFVIIAPASARALEISCTGSCGRIWLVAAIVDLQERMESAREKIGRYREISTKATKIPMMIMITGSIKLSAAVTRVATSSS